jgi:hypothetical protein
MIFFAGLDFWIHLMNFFAAPVAGPRVTIQKLRVPSYWPDLALRSVQATPL